MGFTPWGQRPQDPDQLRASNLAKQLDVSPETIRDRIEGMEDAGAIQGWEAYPNPTLVGLSVGGWAFRPREEETVEGALADVLLVDGVVEVITYHGPLLVVALAYTSEEERTRRLRLIGRLLDDEAPQHVFDPPLPDPGHEPDAVDWRIVRALRGQARRPLREVAEEISKSYRTVKRRFDRLTSEGCLFVVPRVDLSHVSGILPFTLVAMLGDQADHETLNALVHRVEDRALHKLLPSDPPGAMAAIGCFADTLAEMDEIKRDAATVSGVERVHALLSKGRHATDWIDARIEERIAAA